MCSIPRVTRCTVCLDDFEWLALATLTGQDNNSSSTTLLSPKTPWYKRPSGASLRTISKKINASTASAASKKKSKERKNENISPKSKQVTVQKLGCSLTCNLTHSVCLECLTQYISGKVEESQWPVECPYVDCKDPVDASVIEMVLGEGAARWYQLGVDHAISEKVYCPNAKCNCLIDLGEGRVSSTQKKNRYKASCPYCQHHFCVYCLGPGHSDGTCQMEKNAPTLEQLNKNGVWQLVKEQAWKKCPSCGHVVEKNGGCNHMTCRCRRVFCYHCGAWPCRG